MAKKKTKKKSNKKAPAMEMLLVGSKVRAALRDKGVNVGEGTIDTLNGMIHWYVNQAALRAKANGRKTTRPHDVILMEAYNK